MKICKNLLLIALISFTATAQKYKNTENVTVTKNCNGIAFSSTKSFAENIAEVADFSFMKKALENESLLKVLESEEMITVFAISNKGFAKLQEKKDSIFSNSQEKVLTAIIKYHVIPGRVDSNSIKKSIKRHGGITYYTTLQKENLGIKEENGELVLVDTEGNTSVISATDFYHKNGFFHIVDGIVLPEM